jgi:hypothetical protein
VRASRRPLALLLAGLALLAAVVACADHLAFPPDFEAPPQVIAGAGGSSHREREALRHLPVIMIPDNARTRADWLGANCGNAQGSVYQAFRDRGFDPMELWMLDLVEREGRQLTSLELRTDNLKEMIFAVLRYTGAPRVNLLAHGTGAVLAQAALVKYNLFYAVHTVAYVAGPFHGTAACSFDACLDGLPLCCNLSPGSDFLQDLLVPGETPSDLRPGSSPTRYLTVRNGRRFGDPWFPSNPESPALLGARNLSFGSLDHDGLRCAPQVLEQVIPFLTVAASPYAPEDDLDTDDFRDRSSGGTDCDDRDQAVFPGAAETCDDGVDADCNGVDLSCQPGKDRDVPVERLPRAEESGAAQRSPPAAG